MELLFEARKRYQLSILDFIVTSNHIHLIVFDNGGVNSIPRSMQLIAGRTGQEYNRRKSRKGAFWEDRYHATAIESGEHLMRCIVYVDLNMVRAGVVDHPSKWKWSGYHQIQKPKTRYRLIDHDLLLRLLGKKTYEDVAKTHKRWIDGQLDNHPKRQDAFSKSLAVGSQDFVYRIKMLLKERAAGRMVQKGDDSVYQLKESCLPYQGGANNLLPDNTIPWNQSKP